MALSLKSLNSILKLAILSQVLLFYFTEAVFYTGNSHNDFPTVGKRQTALERNQAMAGLISELYPNPAHSKRFYNLPDLDWRPLSNELAMEYGNGVVSGNKGQLNGGMNLANDIGYKGNDMRFGSKLNELQRRLRSVSDYALSDNSEFETDFSDQEHKAATDKRKRMYRARSRAWEAMSPLLHKNHLD